MVQDEGESVQAAVDDDHDGGTVQLMRFILQQGSLSVGKILLCKIRGKVLALSRRDCCSSGLVEIPCKRFPVSLWSSL